MNLTDDQKRAAYAPGSVAVTAGAGTGKTMMLAERYLFHVRDMGLSPLEVVAVTFTDKAADEMRSRIRKEIGAAGQKGSVLAEVDAAQISTIHALAARICRDFYDLAGIPPDFSVFDKTESPMFEAGIFEEAIAAVQPDIIRELGYSWLSSALLQLLKDPLDSEKALSHGPEQWAAAIERERAASLAEFQADPLWEEARNTFSRYQGADPDRLEASRVNAVSAMASVAAGTNLLAAGITFKSLETGVGSKANWPEGGLDDTKFCLRGLKAAAGKCFAFERGDSGDADGKFLEKIVLLREAFESVKKYFSAARLEEKILDYNDLEYYALRILKNPAAVEHYQLRWRAFLVDEFQDTNPVQAEIIQRLTATAALTLVGDEKQAIYGFRGANVAVFRNLYANITEAGGTEVMLSRSFRTHQPLITKMNQLFEPVLGDLHQHLEAERADPCNDEPCVSLHIVGSGEGKPSKGQQQVVEAVHIASEINRMVESGMLIHDKPSGAARKIEYRDFAILSRTWAPLDVYLDALSAVGIPAVHAGGGSLLDTREAKDGFALLRFLADPFDDIALVTVLRSPFFAVSDKTLLTFAQSMPPKTSWWAVMQECGEVLCHEREVLVELLQARPRNSPARLLQIADRLTGYTAVIANLVHTSRREADWRGLLGLLRKLERMGRDDVFSVSRHFKQLTESETEIPRPPLDAGEAVSLMTIHKSKGLEWPVVFVPDLARQRSGSWDYLAVDSGLGVAFKFEGSTGESIEPAILKVIKQRQKASENEEARRVLYVAVTRARDKVILTSTSEKGPDISLLRDGLNAAGIADLEIVYSPELAVPPAPMLPEPLAIPEFSQMAKINIGLTGVAVTALGIYADCPRSFQYRFVDGHPGLGEGSPRARTVGTLAHTALELDLEKHEDLRAHAPGVADEWLLEAILLADRFRTEECFANVRDAANKKEVPFIQNVLGVNLHGIADLAGDDFVLDFKTDASVDPMHHRFQLWAYSRALGKPKAYIAYLRHNQLYEFSAAELNKAGDDVLEVIQGISGGEFAATPSMEVCGYCHYSQICEYTVLAP